MKLGLLEWLLHDKHARTTKQIRIKFRKYIIIVYDYVKDIAPILHSKIPQKDRMIFTGLFQLLFYLFHFHKSVDKVSISVERQTTLTTNVEMIDGSFSFSGHQKFNQLSNFFRLYQLIAINIGAHLLHHFGIHTSR